MNVITGVVPTPGKNDYTVGDEVRVQLVIDEKISEAGEKWKIPAANNQRWLVAGDLTLDTSSFVTMPSDPGLTKIEGTAIVHQTGKANLGELSLESASGKKIQASGQVLAEVKSTGLRQDEPPQWTLPPVTFGTWSKTSLAVLALVLLLVLAAAIHVLIRFFRKKKLLPQKSYDELALNELDELSKIYSKRATLDLKEWKQFSFQFVHVLRTFTDANLHTASHDLTDREFLELLGSTNLQKADLGRVKNILTTLDEVRYGTKKLDATLVPTLIQDGRTYLKNSLQKEVKK